MYFRPPQEGHIARLQPRRTDEPETVAGAPHQPGHVEWHLRKAFTKLEISSWKESHGSPVPRGHGRPSPPWPLGRDQRRRRLTSSGRSRHRETLHIDGRPGRRTLTPRATGLGCACATGGGWRAIAQEGLPVFELRENVTLTSNHPELPWVNQVQIWARRTVDRSTGQVHVKATADRVAAKPFIVAERPGAMRVRPCPRRPVPRVCRGDALPDPAHPRAGCRPACRGTASSSTPTVSPRRSGGSA
jgi:hypothetical protein